MELKDYNFDIHIEKLGSINSGNVFGLYKYLVQKYNLKNHALLESASESSKNPLFSFITFNPDYLLTGDHAAIEFLEKYSKFFSSTRSF